MAHHDGAHLHQRDPQQDPHQHPVGPSRHLGDLLAAQRDVARAVGSPGRWCLPARPGARAYMSLPVIESKLCRGTLASRRPIAGAAMADTSARRSSITTAMRWPGTSKNMRAAAAPSTATDTVITAVAADPVAAGEPGQHRRAEQRQPGSQKGVRGSQDARRGGAGGPGGHQRPPAPPSVVAPTTNRSAPMRAAQQRSAPSSPAARGEDRRGKPAAVARPAQPPHQTAATRQRATWSAPPPPRPRRRADTGQEMVFGPLGDRRRDVFDVGFVALRRVPRARTPAGRRR